ncbi:MAG: peptide chain release factor N(5)-glutamine methyltransferase [bacterium]
MPESLKTVRELIKLTTGYLAEKSVESARLNAERLLGDVLALSRIELYLQHDRPVTPDELDRYRKLIRRRAAGEPLQTLIGATEFYSRGFKVQAGVFIPRPETEILVERCVAMLTPDNQRLLAPLALEIGIGTGVIAISLAAELPSLQVYGTESNPEAIQLAEHNARRHGVAARVEFLAGDRFEPLPARLAGQFDLLVSNPPYIRHADLADLPVEVAEHDPHEALDGGEDGLTFYRALASGFDRWLRPDGMVAVEIGHDQAEAVTEILNRASCVDIEVTKDLNGLPRVVSGRRDPDTEATRKPGQD